MVSHLFMKHSEVVQFMRDTFNSPNDFVPLHAPVFRGNEKKYIIECIDSTFVSSVGQYVNRFEEMVAEYTGAKYAIATVNGTAALQVALGLAGVRQGDEAITQPLTFIATANAISYTGATPVFVDVDKGTMGMSPRSLRTWLEENVEMRAGTDKEPSLGECYNKNTGNRVSAVIPMHTFGHPCQIDEIKGICDEYHIALIEDAAESLGSTYKGKHTGTFGNIGVFSFNGNKVITTGGGMLITDDKEIATLAKHITTTAKVPHNWEYVHDMIGYNYRLTNLAAALGVAQMELLPDYIERKRGLAQEYDEFFGNTDIKFVAEPRDSKANYWLNAVILKDRKERNEFLQYTNDNGVMTRPAWELMNRLPMFDTCQKGELPNAEWLADRLVNIPSSVI